MSHEAVITFVLRFLKNHRDRLIIIIRKWCRNSCDFDDILQNVLLKVYTTSSRFEGRAQLSTWLYRVTVNESIDFFRKNRRHTEGRVDIDGLPVPDPGSDPEEEAIRAEALARVEKALLALGPTYKTAFMLYFINQRTIAEISRTLKISPNAARCKISQAKKQVLMQTLSKNQVYPGRFASI
jgi:RNA polymerase sigma-70 factor, ECF subfamily